MCKWFLRGPKCVIKRAFEMVSFVKEGFGVIDQKGENLENSPNAAIFTRLIRRVGDCKEGV